MAISGSPTTIAYQALPEPVKVETVQDKITRIATEYGINPEDMRRVVHCESAGTFDPTIQSQHILSYGRELSFGLVQIHLPDHPETTYEQAIDPDYALHFLGKHWHKRQQWWTCARILKI